MASTRSKARRLNNDKKAFDEFMEITAATDVCAFITGLSEKLNDEERCSSKARDVFKLVMDFLWRVKQEPSELSQHIVCVIDQLKELNALQRTCSLDLGVIACSWGLSEVFAKLQEVGGLNMGADFRLVDGGTHTHVAVRKIADADAAANFVEFLFHSGLDELGCMDDMGNTPVHWAMVRGSKKLLKMVYRLRAKSFGIKNLSSQLPIHFAASQIGLTSIPDVIIKEYFMTTDRDGNTPAILQCQAYVDGVGVELTDSLKYLAGSMDEQREQLEHHAHEFTSICNGASTIARHMTDALAEFDQHRTFSFVNNKGDNCAFVLARVDPGDARYPECARALRFLKQIGGLSLLLRTVRNDVDLFEHFPGLLGDPSFLPIEIKRKAVMNQLDVNFKKHDQHVAFSTRRETPLADLATNFGIVFSTGLFMEDVVPFTIEPGFANEPGVGEGVLIDWLDFMASHMSHPDTGLFVMSEDKDTILFNRDAFTDFGPDFKSMYAAFGYIVGVALHVGVALPVCCNEAFIKSAMGFSLELDDLALVDSEAHRNVVVYIRDGLYNSRDGADIASLDLFFTATRSWKDGDITVHKEVDLVPRGSEIAVTEENKLLYLKSYVCERILGGCHDQIDAFKRGLNKATTPNETLYRRFCTPADLVRLVAGSKTISVEEWKRGTMYAGVFDEDHRVIRRFWEVVESFDMEQRMKLLRFATGTSRLSVGGLDGSRNKDFTIQSRGAQDPDTMCPEAATCFNTLRLPVYTSKDAMKAKIEIAIENVQMAMA